MWKRNVCSAVVLLLMFATQAAVSLRQTFAENESSTGTRRSPPVFGNTAKHFFADLMPPENLPNSQNGMVLEQKLKTGTKVYFVTLFDAARNIPFYSAYMVTPDQAKDIGKYTRKQGKGSWRTVPGVTGVNKVYTNAIKLCKAMTGSQLSRGHMNPSAINSFDRDHMKVTYTLTNAVPQFQMFNSLEWETEEKNIRNFAKYKCGKYGGTLYMLTGISDIGLKILPGNVNPVQDTSITQQCPEYAFAGGNKKLSTPRAIWSAGCCVYSTTATSFAVMSNNDADQTKLHLTPMSVAYLEKLLTPPWKNSDKVKLFPGPSNC